ncbi:MAG: hypothetical protein IPK67_17175 [Planctomycetes bacterium]|nr:hypothetical protein [Planctomycetota bacterium]
MSLAKHWIRWLLVALLAYTVANAAPQGPPALTRAPRFPEFRGQTLADAVADWTVFQGHPIGFAIAPDAPVQRITNVKQLSLVIARNHNDSLPNRELQAGELIGVVVYPVKQVLDGCTLWIALAALLGMLLGALLGWNVGKRRSPL